MEDRSMNRLAPRLLPLPLLCAALAGCTSPTSLALLVEPPRGGTAPVRIEVRVYDGNGLLASQTIENPQLPGVVHLTEFPTDQSELRLIVLGHDAADNVTSVASQTVATPLKGYTHVRLPLSTTINDSDGDGVPDGMDVCPMTFDVDQKSASGKIPGDACANGGGSCPAGAFCDNFDAPLDSAKWISRCEGTADGCIEIDAGKKHGGASSLHIKLDQTEAQTLSWAAVTETSTFPTEDLFARAWVWVPSSNSTDATAIFTAVQKDAPYDALTLQVEQNGFSMYDGLEGKTKYVPVGGVLPKDKWFCLEWEIKVGVQGAGRMWIDGAQQSAPSLSADTTSTPALGQFSLGLTVQAMANGVPGREIWFDDVVVGGKRAGCQ
jgi:hypothetical protein